MRACRQRTLPWILISNRHRSSVHTAEWWVLIRRDNYYVKIVTTYQAWNGQTVAKSSHRGSEVWPAVILLQFLCLRSRILQHCYYPGFTPSPATDSPCMSTLMGYPIVGYLHLHPRFWWWYLLCRERLSVWWEDIRLHSRRQSAPRPHGASSWAVQTACDWGVMVRT